MGAMSSKLLLMGPTTLNYNCYELGHTWTPSCFNAAAGIGWSSFREGMKLNTAFYLVFQFLI